MALVVAALLGTATIVHAQPVVNPPVVIGANVTLSWTAVDGASSYVLGVGLQPGQYLLIQNIGNSTTVNVNAPAAATYYVVVQAMSGALPLGPPSSPLQVVVTSLHVAPAAPTNLQATFNGRNITFVWNPGAGGGPTAGFFLQAGTSPGGADLGTFPVGAATQMSIPSAPIGQYYVRVVGANGGGFSPASNEVAINMPAGGLCTAPPARSLNALIFSTYVRLSWDPIPGAYGYQLEFSGSPGGPAVLAVPVAANRNVFSTIGAPIGQYYARLTSAFSCGQASTGPETVLNVDGLPPAGRPRAANPTGPTPPSALQLPNRAGVVAEIARQYPGDLRNSCREHGGNNRFLMRVVERLRQEDTRWGLNWKRANVGDMSQDVITYNYSSDPDEGTYWVHVVDVIGGHCGSNPSPSWGNQTRLFSRGARWTLVPFLEAGYIP